MTVVNAYSRILRKLRKEGRKERRREERKDSLYLSLERGIVATLVYIDIQI